MSSEEAKSMSPGLPFPDFSKQKTWKEQPKEAKSSSFRSQQSDTDKLLRDLLKTPMDPKVCSKAQPAMPKTTASPYMSSLCAGLSV